jgi:hypothetical protein
MLWYEAHGTNARKTARHFAIAPKTFHAYVELFNRKLLPWLLEYNTRRPH